MELLAVLVLVLLSAWVLGKLIRGACYILSLMLPGGSQAFDFYFRRNTLSDSAIAERTRRRVRLLTWPWRATVAVFEFLFAKEK